MVDNNYNNLNKENLLIDYCSIRNDKKFSSMIYI